MKNINKKYNHLATISFYHDYLDNKKSGQEWALYLIQHLERYIISIIRKDHRLADKKAEYEDLYQAGAEAVIRKYRTYNPEKSRPTTYFSGEIRDSMRTISISNSMTSVHYVKKLKELEGSLRKQGYDGVSDPGATIEVMTRVSGMSGRVVQNILKYTGTKIYSLSDFDTEISSGFSVDLEVIQKERRMFLYREIKKCTTLEQYLILNSCKEKPEKYSSIVKKIQSDMRFRSLFNELDKMTDALITPIFLKKKYISAVKRLRETLCYYNYYDGVA